MIRKILFRGRRLDNDQWAIGNLITNSKEHGKYYCPALIIEDGKFDIYDDYEMHTVHTATVGQYVGFLDCHLKPIFEGDILRNTYDITDKITVIDIRTMNELVKDFASVSDGMCIFTYEIVGDIYDIDLDSYKNKED